jgi:hypothetical protein
MAPCFLASTLEPGITLVKCLVDALRLCNTRVLKQKGWQLRV